ncbi:MAG: O-antigen ligase family protein [Pseudomonadota bacterium]
MFGANEPVYWSLLAFSVLPLFIAQLVLGAMRGMPHSGYALVIPALLYLAVLGWGQLQTLPAPIQGWAHPYWLLVPEAIPSISANPISGQHIVMRLTMYGMIFWIAINATANRNRALWLLRSFAVFSAGLAVFGLLTVIAGFNPVLQGFATSNVSATFINRNSYATYAVFGLVTNLALYLQMVRMDQESAGSGGKHIRVFIEAFFSGAWLFGFGAMLCLSAVLLSGSRAGTAAAIVAVLAIFACLRERQRQNAALWVSLAIVLGAVATTLSETVVTRVLQTQGDGRFIIYPHVVDGILDRPLLGHGLGAFHDTFRARVPLEAAGAEWERAHSSYLENAYELGLPAAAVLYMSLSWIGIVLLRGAHIRRRDRVFPSVALACFLAGALHSMVDFSLQMPAIAAMFAFLTGIGWAQSWPSAVPRSEPQSHSSPEAGKGR